MFLDQVRMFCDMSLRELVDGIGNHIIIENSLGEVRIGVLRGVRVNVKNEIRSIDVEENGSASSWTDWKSAVFV